MTFSIQVFYKKKSNNKSNNFHQGDFYFRFQNTHNKLAVKSNAHMCVSCNDIDYSCVSSKVLPVSKTRLFLLIFAIKKSLESRSLD